MNVAFKDACNLYLYDMNDKPQLFSDYANSTSFDFGSSVAYAKAKGVNKISFKTDQTGTLTAEFDIYDLKWIAIMLGAMEKTGKNQVARREVKTVSSNTVDVDGTPKTGTVSVFTVLSDEKSHDEDVAVDAVTGSSVDLTTSALADGTKVVVYYLEDTVKEKKFTVNANDVANFYKLRGQALMTSEDGSIDLVEFYCPKIRPQGSFQFQLDASEASSLSVAFDILPDTNGDMMEVVYI